MPDRPLPISSATARYACYGALFGLCFPVVATALDAVVQGSGFGVDALLRIQREQPLHWIIDTAPLFLGLMASLAGWRQDQVARLNAELEQRVAERTADLECEVEQRRVAESRMRAEKARAEDASRAKSEFLATMSHEIRTPLNGVIGMTGLLLDSDLDPVQSEYARTVRSSGEALLSVINDILDVSKMEAGKLELEVVDLAVHALVEETVDLVAQRADERGLELGLLVDHDVPRALRGDSGRLRQILLNLLGNAVKFTEAGEVLLTVGVERQDAHGATLRFAVRDSGIGIPADRLDRLFRSFSQVDSSTTRRFGGTGLGLSISKRLTELMGGRIGVESEEDRGSTFWFTAVLPQADPQADPQASQTQPAPMAELERARVLVVDDNATNRRIAVHSLTHWGCRCDEAADGPAALRLLEAAAETDDPFRLALLDFQMPDMDGAMLAERIRADERLRSLPLLLLTSVGTLGESERRSDLGFASHLVKPVKPSQLLDALRRALGEHAPDLDSVRSPIPSTLTATTPERRSRVLVADDDRVNQKVAARMLEKAGHSCDLVSNGAEAVDAVRRIPYDLVLMDCQMPELNGFDATRQIRALPDAARARTPIVALTANAMQGDREACLEAGMDDYLTKPVRYDELVRATEHWLQADPADADR